MDIVFKEKKFENECNSQRLLKKQYGEKMAKKIRQRLDDLKAVIVLEEMRSLLGRCHELLHNRRLIYRFLKKQTGELIRRK
jgi:proteic killer suppression protein